MMSTVDCRSEELGHTAEIGFRLWAPTLPALFACAAQALFALMFGDEHGRRTDSGPAPVAAPRRTHQVVVVTSDLESLLVEWLNELLYWHEATAALVRVEAVTVAMLPGTLPGRSQRRAWRQPWSRRRRLIRHVCR